MCGQYAGGQTSGQKATILAEGHERGGKFFWNCCLEMAHFGAHFNAAHHHWFEAVTVKRLT